MPLNDNVRTQTNDFLTTHEGRFEYVYIDTGRNRNPTVGYGHNLAANIDNGTAGLRNPDGTEASIEQVREHVRLLRAFAATQNNNARADTFEGRGLNLTAPQQIITNFRNTDVNTAYTAAVGVFDNFDTLPNDAQVAIISVIYNVGGNNFARRYPRFTAAVRRNDFATASTEVNRGANGGRAHQSRVAAERALLQRAQTEQTRRNAAQPAQQNNVAP